MMSSGDGQRVKPRRRQDTEGSACHSSVRRKKKNLPESLDQSGCVPPTCPDDTVSLPLMTLLAVPEKSTTRLRSLVRDERAEISTDDDVPAGVPPCVEVLLDLFGGR